MSFFPRRWRTIAHFLAIVALLLAVAPTVSPSLAQTVPPPTATTAPPTVAPPTATTAPPTATNVPPTATTVPPTATTVPPTNTVPPPTETPSPTATANPFPTVPSAPSVPPTSPPPGQEQPRVTPTPEDRTIACRPVAGATQLVPGGEEWSLYTCSIKLDFGKIEALTVTAKAGTPGWSLILLDPATRDTPGLLEASNNRLDLDQLTTRTSVDVILGVRTTCTALPVTGVLFELRGTAPDDDRAITADGVATLEAGSTLPTLEPTVNEADGRLEIAYSGASTTCGWQLLISLDGEVEAFAEIEVEAPDGSRTSSLPGVISILVPAGETSGTITIATGTDLTPVESIFVEAHPAP